MIDSPSTLKHNINGEVRKGERRERETDEGGRRWIEKLVESESVGTMEREREWAVDAMQPNISFSNLLDTSPVVLRTLILYRGGKKVFE
jgi:hypothetical protein